MRAFAFGPAGVVGEYQVATATAAPRRDMSSTFTPSPPSIVKSIRQRDLLNCWLRLVRSPRSIPAHADFNPERVDDELVDMMVFEVIWSFDPPRFLIRYEGVNLTQAYGNAPAPRDPNGPQFLDDAIGPRRYANVVASYRACIEHCRPTYSVEMVKDQDGKDVAYERLLLPFGAGSKVEVIVGSYKTISIDGGFKIQDIMSANADTPVNVVRAVIDSLPVAHAPQIGEPCDEIIEI